MWPLRRIRPNSTSTPVLMYDCKNYLGNAGNYSRPTPNYCRTIILLELLLEVNSIDSTEVRSE